MKKILIIGSATVDVVVRLDHLPVKSEDVHVLRQEMRLGGCAYNVSDIIRHMQIPYIPFFAVGSGAYGDFVRNEFSRLGIHTPIPSPAEENGCCYCFVEADGERTFASYHGAEYRFYPEWFDLLDPSEIGSVYICGLEIEEITGCHIIAFLEQHPDIQIYFAPGPRLEKIDPDLMRRLFALHPVLHLNESEAISYTHSADFRQAAAALYQETGNTVFVTLGRDGCYYHAGDDTALIPGEPVQQVDTIGAGDSHIGALMGALAEGMSLTEAVRFSNHVSAAVVMTSGATLSDRQFQTVSGRL